MRAVELMAILEAHVRTFGPHVTVMPFHGLTQYPLSDHASCPLMPPNHTPYLHGDTLLGVLCLNFVTDSGGVQPHRVPTELVDDVLSRLSCQPSGQSDGPPLF